MDVRKVSPGGATPVKDTPRNEPATAVVAEPVDSKWATDAVAVPPPSGDGFETKPGVRVQRPSGLEGTYFDRVIARAGLTKAVADGVITEDEAKDVGIAFSVLQSSAARSNDVISSYPALLGALGATPEIASVPADKLLSPTQSGDYLVLCPKAYQAALTPLLNHRALDGHTVALVDPADVYALYGKQGPEPLGQFVSDALKKWAEPKPRFVMLVGDVNGAGPRVPAFDETKSALTQQLGDSWSKRTTFPSDNRYGAPTNAVPELAVGRLPVHSAEEVATTVAKIIAYEAVTKPGLWQGRAALVEGDPHWGSFLDSAVEFFARHQTESAPTLLHNERISYNKTSDMGGEQTAAFMNELQRGDLFVAYTGHGSPINAEGVTVSSAFRMSSAEGNPLVTFTACLTGDMSYSTPTDRALAETMIVDGPAIASIAASDVTMPHNNGAWSRILSQEVLAGKEATIGEIFKRTKQRFEKNDVGGFERPIQAIGDGALTAARLLGGQGRTREEQLSLYNLFGDPATKLRRPAVLTTLEAPASVRPGQSLAVGLTLPAGVTEGTAYVSLEKPQGQTLEPMEDAHQKGLTPQEAQARAERNEKRYNNRTVMTLSVPFTGGRLESSVRLPPGVPAGQYTLRVAAVGEEQLAVGARAIEVQP